ncbi:hypothetical protein GCM10009555_094960 [Acrocarpospora macrocephala]
MLAVLAAKSVLQSSVMPPILLHGYDNSSCRQRCPAAGAGVPGGPFRRQRLELVRPGDDNSP